MIHYYILFCYWWRKNITFFFQQHPGTWCSLNYISGLIMLEPTKSRAATPWVPSHNRWITDPLQVFRSVPVQLNNMHVPLIGSQLTSEAQIASGTSSTIQLAWVNPAGISWNVLTSTFADFLQMLFSGELWILSHRHLRSPILLRYHILYNLGIYICCTNNTLKVVKKRPQSPKWKTNN